MQFDIRSGALDDPAVRTQLSDQLIALKPDVILTQNMPPTGSMLQQTRSIPVVFGVGTDSWAAGMYQPLLGLVENATGFTIMEPMMAGKWSTSRKRLRRDTKRAAFLFDPKTAPYVSLLPRPVESRQRKYFQIGNNIELPFMISLNFKRPLQPKVASPTAGL